MFYLRPGNLYKDFVIEPHIAEKSTTGAGNWRNTTRRADSFSAAYFRPLPRK